MLTIQTVNYKWDDNEKKMQVSFETWQKYCRWKELNKNLEPGFNRFSQGFDEYLQLQQDLSSSFNRYYLISDWICIQDERQKKINALLQNEL